MSAADVSGYVQILIGVVGIVLTLTNIRSLVPDIDHFTKGKGAPPELDNLSGFIRVYVVIFLLILMVFLICFGFSVTISALYEGLSAKFPLLAASMTTMGLIALTLTITLSSYRNRFWVPGVVGTFSAMVLSIISAVNPDISVFWTTFVVLSVVFLVTGVATAVGPYIEG
jgi:hypothetical protein